MKSEYFIIYVHRLKGLEHLRRRPCSTVGSTLGSTACQAAEDPASLFPKTPFSFDSFDIPCKKFAAIEMYNVICAEALLEQNSNNNN